MSNKYSQKFLDNAKKSTADEIKTTPKRTIQKTAEAKGVLIGNKIADKITSTSTPPKELHSVKLHSKTNKNEIEIPKKKIYISSKKTTTY